MKNKKLTFIEGLMLVAGAGMGTGILTIPYAASKIGLWELCWPWDLPIWPVSSPTYLLQI